jgi:KaiC/GvpD/RAD55 family RecA-like ATPase
LIRAGGIADLPRAPNTLGILNYFELRQIARHRTQYLIDELLTPRSVNILVGDSGIGKTPLAIQLGLAVAGGRWFLGRKVSQGQVLYCDAESGEQQFAQMMQTISHTLDLDMPPNDFQVWSPNFRSRSSPHEHWSYGVLDRVKEMKPALVIVDPLRAFWHSAEEKPAYAIQMIRAQRELASRSDCAWLNVHHPRKRTFQNPVSLVKDRMAWFEEAAGSRALINGTDARLGVELAHKRADLAFAGFVRSLGFIEPQYLKRVCDDSGKPQGYQRLAGADFLNEHYRETFVNLPCKFRFRDVFEELGGSSGSNANAFLRQCVMLGLARKSADGSKYVKTNLDEGANTR